MTYLMYPTYEVLLSSYEDIAIKYKKQIHVEEITKKNRTLFSVNEQDSANESEQASTQNWSYNNYPYSFNLLVLNASILEGVLKSILSYHVKKEIESIIIDRQKLGYKKPSRMEKVFDDFRNNIEFEAWGKLTKNYSLFFGFSLNDIVDKEIIQGIQALFYLRNILAHGTEIVQPKEEQNSKDEYLSKWQAQTKHANEYLEKHFSNGDLYKNLAANDIPKHFMELTTNVIIALQNKLGDDIPDISRKTVNILSNYSFGYQNIHQ